MRKNKAVEVGSLPSLWFLAFFVCPAILILFLSFLKRSTYGGIEYQFQFENYRRLFESEVYFSIFARSLFLALVTTVLCLTLAIPVAWAVAGLSQKAKALVLLLLGIPFFMNLVIRIYSVRLLTAFDGPLNHWLEKFGIAIDPFLLSQNSALVLLGMISTYLPYMLFPILVAFEKFDWTIADASHDMGASPSLTLRQVILPGIKPGLSAGILMVFVPCFGEFVIPDLLGGAKNMLVGNLITEQFLKARDWPFGAAQAVVLLVILSGFCFAIHRWGNAGVAKQS